MTQLELRNGDAASELTELASSVGVRLGVGEPCPGDTEICPHLDLATSGVLSITGVEGGAPAVVDLPLAARMRAVCRAVGALSEAGGEPVELDARRVLVERASERGFARRGAISANGSCRLFGCIDGWLACNLPRPDDPTLLAAALGLDHGSADPWHSLGEAASGRRADAMAERLQLFGIAAAVLGESAADDPLRFVRLGAPGKVERPLVVDFSAMWAGPLCAHVLGRSGAEVVTVEDPARPDGARIGDPAMYERLHRGHRLAALSFSDAAGREALRRLVETADVVIEASRPRALAALGLSPERFIGERSGRTWISITGYGRTGGRSGRAAFGDDAAVAGGVVAWAEDRPIFVADAIADPAGGVLAAFGGLVARCAGGGLLVDVSMSGSAAFLGGGPRCRGAHGVRRGGDGQWFATHDTASAPVLTPTQAVRGA